MSTDNFDNLTKIYDGDTLTEDSYKLAFSTLAKEKALNKFEQLGYKINSITFHENSNCYCAEIEKIKGLVCPKCDASTGIAFENEGTYVICQDCDFEGHASEWNLE